MSMEWEISAHLDEAYRLRFPSQIIIWIAIVMGTLLALLLLTGYFIPIYAPTSTDPLPDELGYIPPPGELDLLYFFSWAPGLLLLLGVAALSWPMVIKSTTPQIKQMGNALLLATIFPTIAYIGLHLPNLHVWVLGLTVCAVEILVVQLYTHINPQGFGTDQTALIIFGVLGVIFFCSLALFLVWFGFLVVVFVGFPLTLLFIYSILPEKPT
ncbi:MAG: hypothetical protein ACFFC7_05230 [Candidatus Hermodarchaeota archaeon]